MAQPFLTVCGCKPLVLFQRLLPHFLLIVFFSSKMIRRTIVENLKAVLYLKRLMWVPCCILDVGACRQMRREGAQESV